MDDPFHGKMLGESICLLYQPKVPVQLEVVFIHGLEHHSCGDAYWKTWLARDGILDIIWPMTWLTDDFPSAKVFTLKYDASTKTTDIAGRMDLYLVGEKLFHEMIMFEKIGQNGVPVVFVCHGFGGLVAKQIVTMAKSHSSQDSKAQKLLKNIGAILFYSTPHRGSHLAKFLSYSYSIWGGKKGPLLESLEVLSTNISRLNQDFVQIAMENSWYFVSASETLVMEGYHEMVVDEASSRFELGKYLALNAHHFDVVRPKTKNDSSYLLLTKCLKKVLDKHMVKPIVEEESLVPDSFVGMEKQEKDIKTKLQKVQIVGLVGMGGIGKTTLARRVYQSIHKDFDNSCYLDDIKSKASLDEVLITLLQKLGIVDRKTGHIVEQSGLQDCKKSLLKDLKTYVRNYKILVVIDDVGTEENLDGLLKDMDFLNGNKESKVIVTCRSEQLIKKYVEKRGRYEVEPMSSGQDIELFCYHAFKKARTVEQRRENLLHFLSNDCSEDLISEFESMCDGVVKACGGLPLSLEVMGCCLGGYLIDDDLTSRECLDCWRGALEKLERAEPLEGEADNDRLWKALRISYDCLHENEQNMFLDIACFFCDSVRYGKQTLLRILGGKPSKFIELKNLKERCLVKINQEDRNVTMHDQLRDMGRSIVRQQCQGGVNEMTRLHDFEDVSKLLRSNEIRAPQIQGLSLSSYAWHTSSLANMESKSIGILKRWKIFGKKKGISLECPAMRLLNFHKVQENITKAISIKGLSCIQWLCLKGTNVSKLPKFVQVCNELLVLDMSNCRNLKYLDESIQNLVNLLELNLSNCTSLVSLPNSIGKLVNLLELNLSNCTSLVRLPNSIGKLVNLSTLDICWCKQLESLPNSIGMLVKLSTLDISWCCKLKSLPDSIGKLVKLSKLDILGCEHLKSLPDSIGELVKLSSLEISQCNGLTSLPNSIGKLVNLSTLHIFYCERFTSLPDSIGKLVNLSTLNISQCKGLTSLPDSIGELVNLSKIIISGCMEFTSLPDSIGELVNLSTLHILNCLGPTSLPNSISKLVNLSTLDIHACSRLISLPNSIGELVNLSSLRFFNCNGLSSLPDSIGKLVGLSLLEISYCEGFTSLPDSIGELVNLSKLDISYCKGLSSLAISIGKLVKLSSLRISYLKGLSSLSNSIGELVNLSTLDISGCEGLTSLPDSIGKLVNLSTLDISKCKALTNLPDSIGELVNLSSLDVSYCEGLTSLPDSIGELVNLSSLDISHCKGLSSLPISIGKLVKLSKFILKDVDIKVDKTSGCSESPLDIHRPHSEPPEDLLPFQTLSLVHLPDVQPGPSMRTSFQRGNETGFQVTFELISDELPNERSDRLWTSVWTSGQTCFRRAWDKLRIGGWIGFGRTSDDHIHRTSRRSKLHPQLSRHHVTLRLRDLPVF